MGVKDTKIKVKKGGNPFVEKKVMHRQKKESY